MKDPRSFLSRYGALGREITRLLAEIETIAALERELFFPRLAPRQYSAQLLEARESVSRRIEDLIALRDEISQAIDKVDDDTLRSLLAYRYISDLTWEQIAERMGYCDRNIYRMHRRALESFSHVV